MADISHLIQRPLEEDWGTDRQKVGGNEIMNS